ncbi:hypothetical protein KC901_01470 [Patescibacteria group bacterium]|nr:hypothetical protein [Patescibacteria group bacterium]
MHTFKIFLLVLVFSITASAQVAVGHTNPSPNAVLDLNSGLPGGLIINHVALVSIESPLPFFYHESGNLIWNTSEQNDVSPGFYFNDGSRWLRIINEEDLEEVDYAYDIMDFNVTLTSSDTFTELLDASYASSEWVKISVNLAGSGFTTSLQAIVIEVSIRELDEVSGNMVEIESFAIAPHIEDKDSSVGTAIGWSASIANHPIKIPDYVAGKTYAFVVQAKVGSLYGAKHIDIKPLTHPYHIGSVFVENL